MNIDAFYVVLERNETQVKIKLSDASHPIFKAHFPGHPILPGFIYFEIVSEIFQINIQKINKAKFNSMVKPEAILLFQKNVTNYTVFVDEKKVASFSCE